MLGIKRGDKMKLSTKGKYGLRAMIDLARYSEKEPVSIGSVAVRQGISERYLEQLMSKLKKAGLVKSIRGANSWSLWRLCIGEETIGNLCRRYLKGTGGKSGAG